MPRTIGESSKNVPRTAATVGFLATYLFFLLTAGQFGIDRLGLPSWFRPPFTERLLAAVFLLVLCLPFSKLVRWTPLLLLAQAPLIFIGISALWTPASAEIPVGVSDILTMVAMSISAYILASSQPRTFINTLATCSALVGIVFAVAGIVNGGSAAAFGGGPNVYSRILGLATISIFWMVATHLRSVYWLGFVPILLLGIVLSGSRGGMLATGVAAALLLIFVKARVRLIILGACGAVMAWILVPARLKTSAEAVFRERIVELTIQQRYTSGRQDLAESAISLARDHPFFGLGLNGYAASVEAQMLVTYPHNMALQFLAEGGIAGAGLLLAALIVFFFTASGAVRCGRYLFLISGATLYLVASQLSGSYYDQRHFWVFFAALLSIVKLPDVLESDDSVGDPY